MRKLDNKARNEQRQIDDGKENDNQTDEVGHDCLGNLLKRQIGYARSDKQIDGDRRGNHADGDTDHEQDAEVQRGNTQRANQRQENRRQNDDGGGGFHEHAGDKDDEGDEEEDDILVRRNTQNRR